MPRLRCRIPRLPLFLARPRAAACAAMAAALLALAAATAAPEEALAVEQVVEADFNAQSYGTVPQDQPVEVRIYKTTGGVDDLERRVRDALRMRGWQVVENGGALAFSLEVTGDDPIEPLPDPGVLALEGFRGSGDSTDRLYSRLKLYSTTESSVLTGRQSRDRPAAGGGTRIQADVTDLASGRRLWQGWVVVDPAGRPPERAAEKLLPMLVGAIGQTVRDESRLVEFK